MPFHIPSVRIAQASPSLSLEKGSYRMRAPPSRPSLPPSSSKSRSSAKAAPPASDPGRPGLSVTELVPASYEKRIALLVALLACAMLASFWTAYYLWTTR
ncbi:hypothetical protein C8Q80DRAFT_1275024 [Daedaleopsis nitida]|nr:hypothetical protein C8Q80DRAFT_1275024 [Daedaleopsis nitida]